MRAAQTPLVSDMGIVSSESGICAKCEFSGYKDKSEYVIQLYLYQVKEGAPPALVSYEELEPAGDGSGVGSTAWKHVDTGIYKASTAIKRYDGGNIVETEFADSDLYDVVRNGNSYTVTSRRDSAGEEKREESKTHKKGTGSGNASGKEKEEAEPGCEHQIVYELVKEAEAKRDALLAEQCEKCGAVFSYTDVPNSAYAAFLKEAAQTVENAEGEVAVIVTDRWLSFNQEVLDAIAVRPEVTVVIHYQYGGELRTVTIPAGTERENFADENGFCGFLYLSQLFPEDI